MIEMKKIIVMMVCAAAVALNAVAAQCAATTKKGTQCKRQASAGSSFCWQHGGVSLVSGPSATPHCLPSSSSLRESPAVSQPVRQLQTSDNPCTAEYSNGAKCTNKALVNSSFCGVHQGCSPGDVIPVVQANEPTTGEEHVEETKRRIQAIVDAVEEIRSRSQGKPPSSLLAVRTLARNGRSLRLTDAWRRELVYERNDLDYVIASSGADGQLGTDDDIVVSSDQKEKAE